MCMSFGKPSDSRGLVIPTVYSKKNFNKVLFVYVPTYMWLYQKESEREIDYTSQSLQGHHFSPVLLKEENDRHDRQLSEL